ncbi:MAG: response regulator [Clostridia bacterium]|nr:response regulator [Clostridia bacterium]
MKHIFVLIVEDSVYSADLNVRELKKAGFTVSHRTVMSRKAMEKALNESKWDIILSDHSMPNFNALQALEIRNRTDKNIPFLIVSEDISAEEIRVARERGCNEYISKESLSELRNVVKKYLQQGEKIDE